MNITSFRKRELQSDLDVKPWGNQDLAEFYRVSDILERAGLTVSVDSGITDEGDPWFVFMRPETSDVVAHFARINDQFIAVSSLNQEVYTGANIRAIVNEMLRRHPMLLPSKAGQGKLFLHPTAALTAFIAAAFLISVDGTKEQNLSKIIFASAGLGENPVAENNGSTEGVFLRSESIRTTQIEFNNTNYNQAILGAALISSDLPPDDLKKKSEEIKNLKDLVKKMLDVLPDDETVNELNGSSSQQKQVDPGEQASNTKFESQQTENDFLQADGRYDEISVFVEAADVYFIPSLENAMIAEHDGRWEVNFNSGWGKNQTQGDPSSNVVLHNQVREEKQGQRNTFESKPSIDQELTVYDVSQFVELASELYGKISTFVGLEGLTEIDNFGVRLDTNGQIIVVSVDNLFELENGTLDAELVLLPGVLNTFEKLPGDGSFSSGPELSSSADSPPLSTDTPELITYEFPILGHVLSSQPKEFLELSEAIDVVFYDGGVSTVSGFELGKDLLWFFLSPETLAQSNNKIFDDGSLQLDFGDLGTLTFLDILNDGSQNNFI